MANQMHPLEVVLRPMITEKATMLAGDRKYAFEVERHANKQQIRHAVELAFNVTVTKVNTLNVHGKRRRRGRLQTRTRSWKKALVTVAEGDSIQIFEGM